MEEGDGKGNATESGFWMVLFLFVVLKNKQTKKTHKNPQIQYKRKLSTPDSIHQLLKQSCELLQIFKAYPNPET